MGSEIHLKIMLGYASGVGKSFRMLDEARRRRERGQDIVVAGVQPVVPEDIAALLAKLEVIPLREGNQVNVEAVIRRRPAVCVIDGLAYDNPAGSRNGARWQDALDIAHSGIKVIGSLNVQHVEELRNEVEAITGRPVKQTAPLAFLEEADEIEIVDAPAGRSAELARLRELALVLAANIVDRQLTGYLDRHGIRQQWSAHERILLCLTPRANAAAMIEAAGTTARRFHADWIAAYVRQPHIGAEDQNEIDGKLAAAKKAGASIEVLDGDDPVEAILTLARERLVTQLFIGHTRRSGWRARWFGSPVDRLIRLAEGMDVHVFPQ